MSDDYIADNLMEIALSAKHYITELRVQLREKDEVLRTAVEAEREACAKVADAGFGPESCCPGIATAIRARKP